MNLKLWRSRFREYMEVRNWSPRTIQAYTGELRHLFDFLDERGIKAPNAITRDAMEAYRGWLFNQQTRGRNLKPRTVAARLTGAKAFCRFLAHEQFVLLDPGLDVELPRVPKLLPRPILTQDEVTSLLEATDVSTAIGMRDRAVLELFYSTALRNSELCDLHCADIDFEAHEVRVLGGKGSRQRVVPVGEEAALWLAMYLRRARPQLTSDDEPRLFVTWRGRPLTRETAALVVTRAAEKAGVKRITPHVLRHCCASHMLENGASVRHIQELLGHVSAESTIRYTHVMIDDLHEVHRRCHPREQRSA
ncbi:tyrosine-type recombinase/integrase [Thermomonas sp.]|uniref:tyrosine-type recombinase/integrase n=1 Tax=Thermomonas sp. TaxID=1971895 RepID=UPI002489419F|nr:tyrosine-type recombinase/integrase [Thermomonas sp.]MDI1252773.1 tyrosine-type recombinase/integrase [Thermomonas sp.]